MDSVQEQVEFDSTAFDSVAHEMVALVIDDHRTMRRIVRQMLGDIGITEVGEYSEGAAAWEYLIGCTKDVPDFIICDLHMEGMDGLEFINKIRRSKNVAIHQIPVLILTGDPDGFIQDVASQVGAAKVLQKPISAPDLRLEVADILGIQI